MIDRDPAEIVPKLGIASGCKVALAPELFLLSGPLRLAGCRVVSSRAPVPSAAVTLQLALRKEEIPSLAVFAHQLADVSSLWVALPRKNVEREGLPPVDERPDLGDLQSVFVPLGLSDNKLLSFGTMLVAYRFVRKRRPARAEGGPEADLDLLEAKKKEAARPTERPPRPRARTSPRR